MANPHSVACLTEDKSAFTISSAAQDKSFGNGQGSKGP